MKSKADAEPSGEEMERAMEVLRRHGLPVKVRLRISTNVPIGTGGSFAFVDWTDEKTGESRGEVRWVECPQYSDDDRATGGEVRNARMSAGLTIREAADLLGLSPGRYCNLERGQERPADADEMNLLLRCFVAWKEINSESVEAT